MTETNHRFEVGLCVTGGIAAYKAIEVMRLLQKANCRVRVAMTKHAAEFVQPLTFRSLSDEYVILDDYDESNPDPIAHINFSQSIDLMLVVPATANTIAKFANGVADDFVTSTYLASTAPVMIAPAMNTTMWENPSTQRNIATLEKDGIHFVSPIAGALACKTVGTGKLEDVENIASQALALLEGSSTQEKDLAGESFLITVGGTREAIDPVRFISNRSSGKMGFALATEASKRGAHVTVVAGSTTAPEPTGVEVIRVVSAADMHREVMARIDSLSVFIGAAAVADYRPKNAADKKVKKKDRETISLELERTEDILAGVSEKRPTDSLVVGFAAETNNVIEFAADKAKRKGLDLVVANDITKKGAGFNTDTNIATILSSDGEVLMDLPLMSKSDVASKILDQIVLLRDGKRGKSETA